MQVDVKVPVHEVALISPQYNVPKCKSKLLNMANRDVLIMHVPLRTPLFWAETCYYQKQHLSKTSFLNTVNGKPVLTERSTAMLREKRNVNKREIFKSELTHS